MIFSNIWADSIVRKYTSATAIKGYANAAGIGTKDGNFLYSAVTGGNAGASNVGAKNGSTVSVVEYGFGGFLHKTVLTLTATPIAIADATAGGGVKLYTFPDGGITIMGGSFSVAPTTTSTIASTLKSGVTIEMGVGTASAGAGALTTTEEDLILGATGPTSTVINVAAAAIVSAGGTVAILDGSGTAKTANLNIGFVTATDIDADATATLTGTVTLLWAFNGDV